MIVEGLGMGVVGPQMDESDLCQTDNERREGRVSSR